MACVWLIKLAALKAQLLRWSGGGRWTLAFLEFSFFFFKCSNSSWNQTQATQKHFCFMYAIFLSPHQLLSYHFYIFQMSRLFFIAFPVAWAALIKRLSSYYHRQHKKDWGAAVNLQWTEVAAWFGCMAVQLCFLSLPCSSAAHWLVTSQLCVYWSCCFSFEQWETHLKKAAAAQTMPLYKWRDCKVQSDGPWRRKTSDISKKIHLPLSLLITAPILCHFQVCIMYMVIQPLL